MPRLGYAVLVLVALALTVFAAVRAAPYLRPGRAPVTAPDREQRIRVIENTQVPTYDTEWLKEDANSTRDLVRQAAHQALLSLPAVRRRTRSPLRA